MASRPLRAGRFRVRIPGLGRLKIPALEQYRNIYGYLEQVPFGLLGRSPRPALAHAPGVSRYFEPEGHDAMPCGSGPMKAQELGKEAAPLLRKESWAMLVVGFVFGLAAVVFVPPFVTYDGPNHFLRALQVSQG